MSSTEYDDKEIGNIDVQNLTFRYNDPHSEAVLTDISFTLHKGMVTAIVGPSGSGKSTLLKMLLKFYPPTSGSIKVGTSELANIDASDWRRRCGVVMQDGFIFDSTIAENITMTDGAIDHDRLKFVMEIANVSEFVNSLPQSIRTPIGTSGRTLSRGQVQRILIARALYKNPEVLFFDEATSSLDADSEHRIISDLQRMFEGKMVLIIAHRLSTVRLANEILVIDKGRIVERGSHEELVENRGRYFGLVQNQLDLEQGNA